MIKSIILAATFVTATIYHAVPEQTDDSPFVTASMAQINPNDPQGHRWIAVSRDLEKLGFTFGACVLIEGINKELDGEWEIQDRMNRRWKKRIDLLVNTDRMCCKWDNIKLTLIE